MTVLILSDADDAHADAVVAHLERRSQSYFRLNLDSHSMMNTNYIFEDQSACIMQNARRMNGRDITGVWARRLTIRETIEAERSQDPGYMVWRSEWNRSLFGLYASIRDVYWMNPIAEASLMDNKFYQMGRATRFGFEVPPFITSNDKIVLERFAEQHKDVAVKFMSQQMFKNAKGEVLGLYVNKIGKSDLMFFGDKEENPITIQKYIDKNFEVRLTYIDGQFLACKIESQLSNVAKVDWRRYDIALTPHSPMETPQTIKALVVSFMTSAALTYGAFDFIVDKAGTWWYLEVITAGQWLWIEDLIQLPISESVADCLIKRSLGGLS